MDTLDSTIFRFSPALDLVLYDRLEPSVQARLADLSRDTSFYGVLAPTGERAPPSEQTSVKPVDRESALLLLTLRAPGPIPRYARALLGTDAHRTIAGLVLDGILEIDCGGTFRSGPSAADAVAALDPRLDVGDVRPRGATARLSYAALRHAAMLAIDDVAALAGRLYRYNRLPLDPALARADGDRADADRLGLTDQRLAAALDHGWRCTATGADGGWMSWAARACDDPGAGRRGTVKLYVSPTPSGVRGALAATAGAANAHGALAMKIGTGASGLLRPDKLVVYFARREQLWAAADALASELAGMPAHGVPFTASLDADGLLSWGADPPASAGLIAPGSQSWRSWLTTQLAAALVAAARADARGPRAGDEAAVDHDGGAIDRRTAFAVRRAAALGIDVATWAPPDTMWRETSP